MKRSPEILIVEDDRDEIDVALRALRRSGLDVKVEVAVDGQGALEAVGLEPPDRVSQPRLPQVVFLDLKMPRVDGWEVLVRLRSDPRTAMLPVVVLSSSDRTEDIERSYALGANSFLLKRFDPRGPGVYYAEAARYWTELNKTAKAATV